jgi:hypothetical protein
VNVSQRLCNKKLFEKMVRTQVDRLAWDCRLSPNPNALAIYLEFVPACGAVPKGLKSVNVKMMMFIFIVELGFLVMAIIVGYEAPSTPSPWSIKPNT